MQFFAILLSSILGILSPAGSVVDEVAEDAIADRLDSAEQITVRIDNAPSYRFLQGRAERIRIAGRGLYPTPGVRVAALELETDPIAVDPTRLRSGQLQLEKPLRAGVRLVLSREDINQALQSPAVADRLRNLSLNLLASPSAQALQRYELVDPQVKFLDNDRIRLQVMLAGGDSDRQTILVESGLAIVQGQRLQLIDPQASFNGQPVPSQVINLLIGGLSDRLDLSELEEQGITARILKLEVTAEELTIAGFVSLDPAVFHFRN
ncbi:DUF2993 domain-containing protein [Phormidium tenue FACHB-886]|nr:DUF2993 domain-containing protein [Phormidium tenue FACHB-886]